MSQVMPGRARRHWTKQWARRLLLIGLLVAALYLLRGPILRTIGGGLVVVDEKPVAGEVVLILDADQGCEQAAAVVHAGLTDRILLLSTPPGRLERLGIRDTESESRRKALLKLGIDPEAVTLLNCTGEGPWNKARTLRDWLTANPDAQVIALCDRLNTRNWRLIFDRVMGANLAGRVHWRALPDRRFDETDWWQSKEGVRACVNAYIGLTHVLVYGEDLRGTRQWDPDQFEHNLPKPQ